MNLIQIKEAAKQEKVYIAPIIENIKKIIKEYPEGQSISIPYSCLFAVESYCDCNGIPFYHVVDTTCSVAASYSNLYFYEQKR